MNIYRVDLNLFGAFQAILKTRSVSAAADLYGITQPAMSNALRRLRDLLGDPLFVQTKTGMEPTPFALSIAQNIDNILSLSKEVIEYKSIFDPLESDQTFRIHMSDLGQFTFLPKLFEQLKTQGPHIKIEAVNLSFDQIYTQLSDGQLDFAIGNLNKLNGQGIRSTKLITEKFAILLRKDHPILNADIDLKTYLQADHIVISTSSQSHKTIEDYLEKNKANILLKTSNIIALPHIIANTDMIMTTHLQVAKQLIKNHNLTTANLPIQLPEVDVAIFWQEKIHYDPAHIWLASLIKNLFTDF